MVQVCKVQAEGEAGDGGGTIRDIKVGGNLIARMPAYVPSQLPRLVTAFTVYLTLNFNTLTDEFFK